MTHSPARILVLDDDSVAREFVQEALAAKDYRVDAFTSPHAALQEDLARYDLLIPTSARPRWTDCASCGACTSAGPSCP